MEGLAELATTGLDFFLTVLGSGSSGNCSLIRMGETNILIDGGFSCKEIRARMRRARVHPKKLTAILVSHEHSDHIRSVHTLSRVFKVPVFCTQGTFDMVFRDKKLFDWQEITPGRSLAIGPMCIHPISLPHDAADPIGFRIECEGRKLAHITDFGYPSGLVKESLKGCDTLMVEANHDLDMLKDGPYPWPLKQRIASRLGHLSNESFIEMLPEILDDRVEHMVIGHISRTNNDPRLLTLQLKRTLKRLGLEKIPFHIAVQDEPTETIRI